MTRHKRKGGEPVKNKARYTATRAACGWAGVVIKQVAQGQYVVTGQRYALPYVTKILRHGPDQKTGISERFLCDI